MSSPIKSDYNGLVRVNGMGAPDKEGSYIRLAFAAEHGDAAWIYVSVGAAEVMRDEINGEVSDV